MEAVQRVIVGNDWITVVLITCMALLAVTRYAYDLRFIDFSQLIINDKYLLKTSKEVKFEHPFNLLLFSVQLLSVSLFIYIILQQLQPNTSLKPVFVYVRIFLLYGVFVGVKYFIEKIIGVLFNGEHILSVYHYYKLTYRNYLSILLIPINALFIYTFVPGGWIIFTLVVVLIVINTITLIHTFKQHEKLIINNLFYFILYLCALEIAPYFILYKVLSDGIIL